MTPPCPRHLAPADPRRLTLADMDHAAAVHRAGFDAALPWLAGLHTPDEDRAFYRNHVFRTCAVWGIEADGAVVGIVAARVGWIDQLYVLPGWQRRGIGGALLRRVQDTSDGLSLWCFQRNAPARRFYEAHGFAAAEHTDGRGNEEREPDVRYRWQRP